LLSFGVGCSIQSPAPADDRGKNPSNKQPTRPDQLCAVARVVCVVWCVWTHTHAHHAHHTHTTPHHTHHTHLLLFGVGRPGGGRRRDERERRETKDKGPTTNNDVTPARNTRARHPHASTNEERWKELRVVYVPRKDRKARSHGPRRGSTAPCAADPPPSFPLVPRGL
jgi:hypothetical protein